MRDILPSRSVIDSAEERLCDIRVELMVVLADSLYASASSRPWLLVESFPSRKLKVYFVCWGIDALSTQAEVPSKSFLWSSYFVDTSAVINSVLESLSTLTKLPKNSVIDPSESEKAPSTLDFDSSDSRLSSGMLTRRKWRGYPPKLCSKRSYSSSLGSSSLPDGSGLWVTESS